MPTTRAAWITTGAICGYRVTEYLPHSYSIIYKIDPLTMTATEVFDYDDSIGAIVCNTDDRTLVGMNWDARDFYHWTLDGQGSVTNADVAPKELAVENPSLGRLSGWTVSRRLPDAGIGPARISHPGRRSAFGRMGNIRFAGQPSRAPNPGPDMVTVGRRHDKQPLRGRIDSDRPAGLFRPGRRRQSDAVYIRYRDRTVTRQINQVDRPNDAR